MPIIIIKKVNHYEFENELYDLKHFTSDGRSVGNIPEHRNIFAKTFFQISQSVGVLNV